MAGDIVGQRGRGMALRVNSQNRADLIGFYKALAKQDGKRIPPEMKKKESLSKAISDAESLLAQRSSAGSPPDRIALAAFLIDRTKKVRDLALHEDRLSFFSLYISLRNRIAAMLGPAYYEKPASEALDDYIDIEPLVAACSELCGLQMPSLDEIVQAHTP